MKFFITILVLAFSTLSHANPVDSYFFNKNFIDNINWRSFEKNMIWVDKSMVSTEFVRKSDGANIIKKSFQEASKYESDFYVARENDKDYSMGFNIKGINDNVCTDTVEYLRKKLGKESIYIDNSSYFMSKDTKLTSKIYRWDGGNTSFRLKCFSILGETQFALGKYIPINLSTPEMEPVKFKCEINVNNKGNTIKSFSMAGFIIPEEKMITNEERFFKGKLDFTDSYYKLQIGEDSGKMSIEIDRYSGLIRGAINGTSEPFYLSGKCENIGKSKVVM